VQTRGSVGGATPVSRGAGQGEATLAFAFQDAAELFSMSKTQVTPNQLLKSKNISIRHY
jgi:hypothetical protein